MKVILPFLQRLHLDGKHFLLTGRALYMLKVFFDVLDCKNVGELDDIQFKHFMQHATDLSETEIYDIFDRLDVNGSGTIEFDEFYLLVCMMISVKDGLEKEFVWRHSRACFELLDEDGSKFVSVDEFDTFASIFNISKKTSQIIFKEFDVDGNKKLDYEEFRMFSLMCLDKVHEIKNQKQAAGQNGALEEEEEDAYSRERDAGANLISPMARTKLAANTGAAADALSPRSRANFSFQKAPAGAEGGIGGASRPGRHRVSILSSLRAKALEDADRESRKSVCSRCSLI